MKYDEVKRHYQNLLDGEIRRLIKNIKMLDKIGRSVLLEEVIRRGFPSEEIENLKRNVIELSDENINQLLFDFVNSDCPICGKRNGTLSGISIRRAISILIYTFTRETYVIGCEVCLKKLLNKDQILTLCFGWWSMPFGLIITPMYIIHNIKEKKKIGKVDERLRDWVIDNIKLVKNKLNIEKF